MTRKGAKIIAFNILEKGKINLILECFSNPPICMTFHLIRYRFFASDMLNNSSLSVPVMLVQSVSHLPTITEGILNIVLLPIMNLLQVVFGLLKGYFYYNLSEYALEEERTSDVTYTYMYVFCSWKYSLIP